MARGGRGIIRAACAVAIACAAAESDGGGPGGYVAMPHPNACRCEEEDAFCDRLWEKLRPGHRDRYLTYQNRRHLHHPECPPWCMENFGYYQTCWRRFPEHTLGCPDCWDSVVPTLPPPPVPLAPVPSLAPPPAPVEAADEPPASPMPLEPALPQEDPTDEYDPRPAPEPETVPEITPLSASSSDEAPAWINDPLWQAGLIHSSEAQTR